MMNLNKFILELHDEALTAAIPIMEDDAMAYFLDLLAENNVQSLLEIGTAVGYSSISMVGRLPQLKVVTIEKDLERFEIACENVKKAGLQENIEVVNADAREYVTDRKFQAIFLDGPKAHNQELFDKFDPNLEPGGLMIIDDVYFHGYVDHPEFIRTKRMRAMIRKLTAFKENFMNNPEYDVQYLEIGDGILVGKKKD